MRHDTLGLGQGHGNAHFAAGELAQGHVLLVGALLAALAAWLTRGRGNRAQVLQEIRSSPRLGPRVAQWLEQHEEALRQHPALQSRRHPEAGTAGTGGGLPPELPRETAAGGRGGRDGAKPLARETKVPCFHPFDKKKFAQMDEAERKGYLKEMSDQLQRQQDQINRLSAVEYKAARDAFENTGRNPLAEGAQAAYRGDFARDMSESIRESLRKDGMSPAKAEAEAISRTRELMSKLSGLHEPDMVAGGWMQPSPKGMGRSDVNSSIGASWNQEGRIASMDFAADEAIRNGRGGEKMNVKLEPCRGKGMR